jgi:hypothetical protein
VQAIKDMIKVARNGGSIILYPAGQSSFTGESTYIDQSIAKLVRKLGLPVVTVLIEGAHIALPKFNMKTWRRSRIEMKVTSLIDKDELGALSDLELYEKITAAIHFDDYEWQRKRMIPSLRPRCVEGAEQFLFLCPNCQSEFTITTQKNVFTCTACNAQIVGDRYGFLKCAAHPLPFDTPTGWNRWQFAHYDARLIPGFAYSEDVELRRLTPGGKAVPAGEGRVMLDLENFSYIGSCDGLDTAWSIHNKVSAYFSHEQRTSFEVVIDKAIYCIAPVNPKAVFKFILLKETIYRKLYAAGKLKAN